MQWPSILWLGLVFLIPNFEHTSLGSSLAVCRSCPLVLVEDKRELPNDHLRWQRYWLLLPSTCGPSTHHRYPWYMWIKQWSSQLAEHLTCKTSAWSPGALCPMSRRAPTLEGLRSDGGGLPRFLCLESRRVPAWSRRERENKIFAVSKTTLARLGIWRGGAHDFVRHYQVALNGTRSTW